MYYLLINGQQQGPYPREQVQAMLASGQIGSDLLSWTEGMTDWQPVEHALAFEHTPPPVAAPAAARSSGVLAFFGGVGVTLAVVGAVLLGLLIIAGGLVGYLFYVGNGLDQSSKAYVDAAIPAIVTSWSPDELVKRESKAFQKATNDQQLVGLFTQFRRLGALKSYEGCKGDSNINYTPPDGKIVTATYLGHATFENGEADIRVILIQEDGAWKIQSFRINSPIFGS